MKTTLFFCFVSFLGMSQLSEIRNQTKYNFWLNLPETEILNNQPPVLIFLHGRSLSGTDMNKVKRYGVISEIEKGRKIPAIVIAPQVVSGAWDPEKIIEILDFVQKKYNTNTDRVYVCGMSLGGYGTLSFTGKYPDRIAASVALCGGGNISDACNLAKVPLWIQHGTGDRAVPISVSRNIVQAIKNCNSEKNLKYVEVKGASHGAMESVFRSNELYDWLFSHSLSAK